MKIKKGLKVLLSVCLVFAGIIIGLLLIKKNMEASRFTSGFGIGLSMLRMGGKLVYWSCAVSAILVFATAVVDAVLKQRVFLSPLLSAVAFLLTLIPFALSGFIRIPPEWFVAIALAVYVFALILSMRKTSRLSLGRDAGFISLLKQLKQVKFNNSLDKVDKTITMTLFWLMFAAFLTDLGLLIYHVIMNRQVLLH